jgi:hypothetical protein
MSRFPKQENVMRQIKIISILVLVFCFHAYVNAEELAEDMKAVLWKIAPSTAYKYFSGYYENNHNHPAMYAYGYKENAKLVVTGRGFYKEFSINEWSKAIEAYKSILVDRGYEPTN